MFDPYGFFRVAGRLAGGDEAEMRTAVDRAYYAAFLMARDKLGVQVQGPEVHQIVIERLHCKHQHKIAQRLQNLRHLRNLADYRMTASVSTAQSNKSLALSRVVIEWVRTTPQHPGQEVPCFE